MKYFDAKECSLNSKFLCPVLSTSQEISNSDPNNIDATEKTFGVMVSNKKGNQLLDRPHSVTTYLVHEQHTIKNDGKL